MHHIMKTDRTDCTYKHTIVSVTTHSSCPNTVFVTHNVVRIINLPESNCSRCLPPSLTCVQETAQFLNKSRIFFSAVSVAISVLCEEDEALKPSGWDLLRWLTAYKVLLDVTRQRLVQSKWRSLYEGRVELGYSRIFLSDWQLTSCY